MNFLCDVHISHKVVKYLRSQGFKAFHVNEILNRWHTKDQDICTYADEHDLIVITKDSDFKNSFLISNTPGKLVKVNLGNVATSTLIEIISTNLFAIQSLNSTGEFMVELDQSSATFMRKL